MHFYGLCKLSNITNMNCYVQHKFLERNNNLNKLKKLKQTDSISKRKD